MERSISLRYLNVMESLGFFSKVGCVMYPLLSLTMFAVPSVYNYISATNSDNSGLYIT